MISILIAFFTSLILTIVIIRTQKLHGSISGDVDLEGPQKFHSQSVPRIGGFAIGLGLFTSILVHNQANMQGFEKNLLLACAMPVFGIGICEDLTKKVSVRIRLLFTAFGALLATQFLNIQITSIGISGIDLVFSTPLIAILFTVFAITGLANAYNIIDGFNGLSSMVGIITLLALGYMGLKMGDPLITSLSLIMASAIMGFFLLNYPKGLIFLGDGGAYLIGFWVACLSVMLVNQHQEVSPWFAVMVNAYPIMETLFTIYRRRFHQGKSLGHPDGIHFHSLIFRRILNPLDCKNAPKHFDANSRTSPYLWLITGLSVIPAVLFWQSSAILMGFIVLFASTYIWLYKKIVSFKTPKWMHP